MQQAEPTLLDQVPAQLAPALRVRLLARLQPALPERVAVLLEQVLPERVAVLQVEPTLPGLERVAEAARAHRALALGHRLAVQVARARGQQVRAQPEMALGRRVAPLPGLQLGLPVERVLVAWQQAEPVAQVRPAGLAAVEQPIAAQAEQEQVAQWQPIPVGLVAQVQAERAVLAGLVQLGQVRPIAAVQVRLVHQRPILLERAPVVVQLLVVLAVLVQQAVPGVVALAPVQLEVLAVQVAQVALAELVERVAV